MRVLIAPDKFKGSLTAQEVAELVRETLESWNPKVRSTLMPVTDGGDGFATIFTKRLGGELNQQGITGPTGGRIRAQFGLVRLSAIPPSLLSGGSNRGQAALLEVALTGGLAALPSGQRNPWNTSTRGLGELIADLAESGVRHFFIGLGGSATQDLGLGALTQLGLQMIDRRGNPLGHSTPSHWPDIGSLRWEPRFPDLQVQLVCDVTNPLLGERGTVAFYAVQKGLPPQDIPVLESATRRISSLMENDLGVPANLKDMPGVGAAGGIAYGMAALMGAKLTPGDSFFAHCFELEKQVAECDLVITGEGMADRGTTEGKGPGMILRHAVNVGIPGLLIAGSIQEEDLLRETYPNCHIVTVTPEGMPLARALPQTRTLLRKALEEWLQRTYPNQ